MTHGIPWPVSYGIFTLGMVLVGWITFVCLRYFETRKLKNSPASNQENLVMNIVTRDLRILTACFDDNYDVTFLSLTILSLKRNRGFIPR